MFTFLSQVKLYKIKKMIADLWRGVDLDSPSVGRLTQFLDGWVHFVQETDRPLPSPLIEIFLSTGKHKNVNQPSK